MAMCVLEDQAEAGAMIDAGLTGIGRPHQQRLSRKSSAPSGGIFPGPPKRECRSNRPLPSRYFWLHPLPGLRIYFPCLFPRPMLPASCPHQPVPPFQ